jgi:putative N6-adenine-specific DNA methylase
MTTTGDNLRFVAKTMQGLAPVVSRELLKIGAREIEEHHRAVSFVGDLGTLYKANYMLRTALRILFPIAELEVNNEKELYEAIRSIDWSQWMTADDTLAVDCTLNSDFFNHSQYVALKTKDAIVDQFRDATGRRPSVDLDEPTLRINIHISDTKMTVSLDSSGSSLHKRGYRVDTGKAPMNEVLAAGLIQLSGWERHQRLIDPMCGSGTILIEAAMSAANIPAGFFRPFFGFTKWKNFDEELWTKITEGAISRISEEPVDLTGIEISPNVIRKAKANILEARVEDMIKLFNADFRSWTPPEGRGLLIMNPPYGERMDNDDLEELYVSIGTTLKKKYSGYDAWLVTSSMEGIKHIGLRPSRKITVFNGPLECKFLKFEMYSGTKKIHKLKGAEL